MYCSACGARVPDGHTRCDTCGAPVSRAVGFGVPGMPGITAGHPVTLVTCPRCGFQGQTVGYFSQGGPVAGLLVLTLMTLPFMGAGGILFYVLRHDHRSCARCGNTLGKSQHLALAASAAGVAPLPAAAAAEADLPDEAGGGGFRKLAAWAFFLFAAFMMMIGFAEAEFVAFMFSAMSAGAGALLLRSASSAREERRQALLVALQQPVLRLAGQQGGRLTVTQTASMLNWPIRRAEKVLNSLEDGLRVSSDVTNEGVIVYEFRELMHAPRLSAGEMDTLLAGGARAAQQAQPQPAVQQHPQDGTLRA